MKVMQCDACGGREKRRNATVTNCPWCGEGAMRPREDDEWPPMECAGCGVTFKPPENRTTPRYCTERCGNKAKSRISHGRPEREGKTHHQGGESA